VGRWTVTVKSLLSSLTVNRNSEVSYLSNRGAMTGRGYLYPLARGLDGHGHVCPMFGH